MKTLLITLTLLAATAWLTPAAAQTAEASFKTSAQCQMCKDRLEEQMMFQKGVKKVELDLATKVLHVWYSPKKVTLPELRTAVNKIGYDADDQLADQAAHDALPMCCQKTAGPH